MYELTETLLTTLRPTACVCCDAEFARGMEMLELSIVDICGNIIYQQRFKPRHYRTWSADVHHITPEMVASAPSFSSCRRRIQAILDKCRYIVGFAVRENDLNKMKRQYVQGLDSKNVLELRDWFWICYGREHSLDYRQGISLKLCCEKLGIGLDENQAHSSVYDACMTLKCFKILFDSFVARYDSERHFCTFADVTTYFATVFKKYKYEYDLERASGYCYITRAGEDFMLKSARECPEPDEQIIECIAVENRKKAVLRISEKFTGSPHSRSFFFHNLTDSQLDYFRRQQAKSLFTTNVNVETANHE